MGLGSGSGAAEYSGRSSTDASRYIDNSEGVAGFRRNNPGHPRQHVSIPNHSESEPCVEKYSFTGPKSGFQSRSDQDLVGHYVLAHQLTQAAMAELNEYSATKVNDNCIRKTVNLSHAELGLPQTITCGQWHNGERTDTFEMRTITIVLQHFNGKETDPNAPVHILTFFPRYR